MIKIDRIFFDRKYNEDDTAAWGVFTTPKPVISWRCIGGEGLTQKGFKVEIKDGEKTVFA